MIALIIGVSLSRRQELSQPLCLLPRLFSLVLTIWVHGQRLRQCMRRSSTCANRHLVQPTDSHRFLRFVDGVTNAVLQKSHTRGAVGTKPADPTICDEAAVLVEKGFSKVDVMTRSSEVTASAEERRIGLVSAGLGQ